MAGIPTSEYYQFKSVIETANSAHDKDALREIQKQLIVKYGIDNDDVKTLIKKFRYTV